MTGQEARDDEREALIYELIVDLASALAEALEAALRVPVGEEKDRG